MTQADKISIHDLAERVGLSAATVSRVLNNRRGIGKQTRQRVMDAAREAGFRPRVAARSTTIAVVMDHATEPGEDGLGFPATLTMQVARALARHQLAVEFFTSGNLDVLPRRFVDGVLAIAWRPETLEVLQRLENVPIVIFNRPEYPTFSNVQVNHDETGRIAATHFLDHGHTRLGFLGIKRDYETNHRLAGFRQAIEAAGLDLPDECIGMTDFLSPYSTVQRLLRTEVTALFIACEHLSVEIPYLCAEALRLSIPEELSLIGMNIASALKFSRPPMTLIASPIVEMADAAVKLLDELVHTTDRQPRRVTLRPELIARDSVARVPSAPATRDGDA